MKRFTVLLILCLLFYRGWSQECPDYFENEDVSIVLPSGERVGGLDAAVGTPDKTHGSPCGFQVMNVDNDQPWARYVITINLLEQDIQAGSTLLVGIDGRGRNKGARIEVNQDNEPNAALFYHTFGNVWSRAEAEILVPEGIKTLDIWLFSNYKSAQPETSFYDNLRITKLEK